MQIKEGPAQALLTMVPEAETTIDREGFLSALYRPEADAYPGKVLIVVGGSDGAFSLTKLVAEQYVERGLSVLALAYWGQKGLPMELQRIPLEYAEKAALWLRNQDFEKVGMLGISMGAQYSLLCGSYFPDLITCVTAISPINVCTQALQQKNAVHRRMKLLEGSVFSYDGENIPFAELKFLKGKVLLDSLKGREPTFRSCYEGAVLQESAAIPAERITGPVLLLAAETDSMWPSAQAAEKIKKRREICGLSTEYFHYRRASHMLLPYKLRSRKLFAVERKDPDACWQSDLDAFQQTLLFLRNSW